MISPFEVSRVVCVTDLLQQNLKTCQGIASFNACNVRFNPNIWQRLLRDVFELVKNLLSETHHHGTHFENPQH